MKIVLVSATILTLAMTLQAQYTPGVGGSYIGPSTPYIPGPVVPVAPTPPSYTWETPITVQPFQPQPVYTPTAQPVLITAPTPTVLTAPPPETIRIVSQPQQIVVPQLSDAQIADITASIALYPDVLLAIVLPAATNAEELTYADRWQEQHPNADERSIASLPLDDAVKAIMHYPTVLNMMVTHLDWTQALGLAFIHQRNDLLESVQRWRATAVANGYLYSTQQQDVFQQGTVILIQPPARTQVVYVPTYDPAIIYVRPRPQQLPPRNVITFGGSGISLSFALNDVDWRERVVRVPRHDDPRDGRQGPGPGDRGPGRGEPGRGDTGRGPGPEPKTVFVPAAPKPGLTYAPKVVTPQPDKKVVTLSPTSPFAGRGPANPLAPPTTPASPGRSGATPTTPGRGAGDSGIPGTPGTPGRGSGGSGRGLGGI